MGKSTMDMRIWRTSFLLFGFLSHVYGYFHVPGMEKLDTPYDHLFRGGGGPAQSGNWDDTPSTIKHPMSKPKFKPELPQMHSFYLKMEDPRSMLKPSGTFFLNQSPMSHFSYPPTVFNKEHEMITPIKKMAGFTDSYSLNNLYGYSSDPEIGPGKTTFSEYSNPPMIEHPGPVTEEGADRTMDGEQRVVGGRDVSDGEIPWQVSLQRKSMKSGRIFHICGGSIINHEWVVTAAHCVALALLSNYRIVSATTNLRDENRIKGLNSHDYSVHKVVDVHIHDEYDMFRFRNDIALIRVEPPFQFGHNVKAIALPSSGMTAHGMAYASGWGLTQEGVRVTPSRLQAVALPIVSDHECRQAYGDNLAETMICAGYKEGGKSVCQGDSGGPLFQNHGGQSVLIGVVSWGVGCARPGKPGVYTEVSHYIGWIQDVTGGTGRQNYVR